MQDREISGKEMANTDASRPISAGHSNAAVEDVDVQQDFGSTRSVKTPSEGQKTSSNDTASTKTASPRSIETKPAMTTSAMTKASSPKPKKHGPPKALIVVVILALIGFAAYKYWQSLRPEDKTKLFVSGRVDGYETNIGAKIAGRVEWIGQREGDELKPGQLVVKLSDEDIRAQLRGAQARLQKAMDARDQSEQQVAVAENDIEQAKMTKDQSVGDAEGRILQAGALVASARANLAQAEAQLEQAKADHDLALLRKGRYSKLARQGAVSQDDADQAVTNEATAEATVGARKSAVDSARKQLLAAEGNLTQAKTNAFNPGIRMSQLLNARRQLSVSQDALKSANEEINNCRAACDEIKANIAYLNLPSPIHAIVTARSVEPGAVVSAGQTVLACINLDTVYLRGFVPDKEIGRVRVGQRADIYLDAMPKQPFPGKVIEIDPVASFTPENIYFKDDRVKQTFGIKIAFDDPQRFPKPGMPADAYIYTDQPQGKL